MKVNEIFYSVQGEGSNAGAPCVFVRLSGCNYECSWCDTKYHTEGENMTITQIKNEIIKYKCNLIEFTGGEPLLQASELVNLVGQLKRKNKTIIVETNNSILPEASLRAGVDKFIVDFKCPSSKVPWGSIQEWNASKWKDSDEIKFVVADKEDVEFASSIILKDLDFFRGQIFFSPVWGSMSFQDLSEIIKDFGEDSRIKMQLQMHKLIWDVDKRGV